MRYRVNQVKVSLEYTDEEVLKKISRKLSIPPKMILSVDILKRSVDARQDLAYTLTVEITVDQKLRIKNIDLQMIENENDKHEIPFVGKQKLRPIVVGCGPSGLTAAWVLAKAGMEPILIDRGESVDKRSPKINRFWMKGILEKESNVLFGEGGAGLFSDGKLTARSKDHHRVKLFLELLVRHGADKEILIETHPHVGTDRLMKILPSIRREIVEWGGEFRFSTRLESIITDGSRVTGIETTQGTIDCNTLVLAIGHSASDTYRVLYDQNIKMVPKPFAVGVRVELPQDKINQSQWGCSTAPIGAASFRLTRKEDNRARACYSFCMCPGGEVISCASDEGMITSNGMSYHNRNLPFGNAAFLVPVTPEDFCAPSELNALSGIEYQENLERLAFEAGGSDYALPVSLLDDFLRGGEPTRLPEKYSARRVKAANLHTILPDYVAHSLKESLPEMLRKLGNPPHSSVLLYGTETRSSAPLQMTRDENGESVSHRGLYPTGEGAGYAGGIVSSGIDGIKTAESIIARL